MQREPDEDERRRLLYRLKRDFFLTPLFEHKYVVEQVIGEGTYGVVCSATNTETGEKVAVKRIMHVFDEAPEATRTLRELKFLRLLQDHENIISIKDVLLPSDRDKFEDVFVVLELMPTDLSRVLRARIDLSPDHIRWLIFQLIRGIYYIHSCSVFHRDLKPSNVLINASCDLRIVDFGLSRAAFGNQQPDTLFWTDYVATRWYRAPELIMAGTSNYTTAIDMWSVGCIFAEMLNNGRPIFPGHNPDDQLELIVAFCGKPPADVIANLQVQRVRDILQRCPPTPPKSLNEVFPNADPLALDLLSKILEFDPQKRLTAEQALQHPYLQMETVVKGTPIDVEEFAFERRNHTIPELRALFFEEILKYHPEKRNEYLNPRDTPVLKYMLKDQAARFRDQLRATQNGTEPPRPYDSMPNQRFTNYVTGRETVLRQPQSQVGSVGQQVEGNGMITTGTTTTDAGGGDAGGGGGRTTSQMQDSTQVQRGITVGTSYGDRQNEQQMQQEMAGEEQQLMNYAKFSSVESASSMAFGAVVDRRVSETLDSMMDPPHENVMADINNDRG